MLREYQGSAVIRDGVVIIKDEKIERKLVNEVEKIVNAIIMVYRYYIFEDYDDLKQHALQACYKNFVKFNPDKGTCFNYFSLISKKCLLNFTDRQKKHRNHHNIEDQLWLESRNEVDYETFFNSFEDTLFNIIDENFIGNKRKKYIKIATLMLDYFRKTKKFISKSDLYAWIRSFGIKTTETRAFIKEMAEYNSKIFSIVS